MNQLWLIFEIFLNLLSLPQLKCNWLVMPFSLLSIMKKKKRRKAAIDSQSQERKVPLTDNIESRSWNGVFFGNGWVLFFYLHQMWPKPSPTLTCPYLKLIVSGIDETSCSNINFWGVEFLAQMNLNVLLSTLKKGLAASLPSARSDILTAQRKLFLIFKTLCTVSSA